MHPEHPAARAAYAHAEPHDDIIYPSTIPFILVHLACLGAIWTGVSATAVAVALVLYLVRMWGITAGFHRYFSHRSYKTSRVMQFVMAFIGQSSAQRGVIWWSAIHRHHHLHSDTEEDIHSPRHMGFLHSHVGWIFRPKRATADYSSVPDLIRFPELVWLDRFHLLPAILLGVGCFLLGGWQMLVVGFFWSTVVLYHGVFFINSLAHVVGSQRYLTGDDSRNNWWLALITLGEGWHNNHHHYQSATAQGWRWYEVDISYYVIKAMSWVGLVWDLRAPPERVLNNEQPVGRKVLEKVASQVAATVPVEGLAQELRERWSRSHVLDDLVDIARRARTDAEARLEALTLPDLPTLEELEARAREMFDEQPSLSDVAERAREMILEALSAHLLDPALEPA
ncbi:MAG: fatty acid desaturase [Gemmatimonadetes bacterium]|nr:fatty acid desaturase [Gemmatimonadota bacterium]